LGCERVGLSAALRRGSMGDRNDVALHRAIDEHRDARPADAVVRIDERALLRRTLVHQRDIIETGGRFLVRQRLGRIVFEHDVAVARCGHGDALHGIVAARKGRSQRTDPDESYVLPHGRPPPKQTSHHSHIPQDTADRERWGLGPRF
jgi:hypothetical protein